MKLKIYVPVLHEIYARSCGGEPLCWLLYAAAATGSARRGFHDCESKEDTFFGNCAVVDLGKYMTWQCDLKDAA